MQHIIPDMTKPPSRRLYLMMGALVGVLALISLVMAIAIGVLYAKNGAWKDGMVTGYEGSAHSITQHNSEKVSKAQTI